MSGTGFDERRLTRRKLFHEPRPQVAPRRDTPTLGQGEYVETAFRIAVRRSTAGHKARLRFVATADDADRANEATLNVKRKRKRG